VDNKEVGVDNKKVFNKNIFSDQKKPRFYLMWKTPVENVENPQSRMFIKKFFRAPFTQLSNHSPRFYLAQGFQFRSNVLINRRPPQVLTPPPTADDNHIQTVSVQRTHFD